MATETSSTALGHVSDDPTRRTPPKPVPGCDVCGALAKQWKQAMERGPAYDPSHAVDLAVEISRHPHPRPQNPRPRKPRR